MKARIFVAVLLLFAISTVGGAKAQSVGLTINGGTLIVAIPSKDGLAICADKRLHHIVGDGGDSDNFIKIRQLGPKTFYVVTGAYTLSHDWDLGLDPLNRPFKIRMEDFDVYEFIDKYFKDKNLENIAEYSNDFASSLYRELVQIKPELLRGLSGAIGEEKPFLLQIVVFYLDNNNQVKGPTVVATYTKQLLTDLNFIVKYGTVTKNDFATAEPIFFGEPEIANEVTKEVKEGREKRFDDLKINKTISVQSFLLAPPLFKDVVSRDAISLARRIIKLSSERGPLLNPDSHIGPISDCALLSFKNGFTWIPEAQLPTKPLKRPQTKISTKRKLKTNHLRRMIIK